MPTEAPIAITSAMLAPLTDAVVSNLGVILPVGLGLMAVMLGIRLIPRVIHSFF